MPQTRITIRPPTWPERLWYRRLRIPPPRAVSPTPPDEAVIRLLPWSWHPLHRAYARRKGLFWLPCVLCGAHHGGHQMGTLIPDPLKGPGWHIGICPDCTRAGRGWRAHDPFEDVLDEIADAHAHGDHDEQPVDPDCARCTAWTVALRRAIAERPERPQWP